MRQIAHRHFAAVILFAAGLWPLAAVSAVAPAREGIEFFEKNIRPLLVAECYECHSGAKKKGGLTLDTRDGVLKGGESGPALVPGNAETSRLIKAVRRADPDLQMPPKTSLTARQVADLVAWVKMGAPDPRVGPPSAVATGGTWPEIFAARRTWWSFQPVKVPSVPTPKNAGWSGHPVDRFLLAKMEERGLQPGADADPRTLIRRLTFALTGLPPRPEEVEAFVREFQNNHRASAIAAATDRLLASPAFAERWARHWMDLVRYAETHGSEGDPEIPQAWRYRDYLIRAFAADVPADQLIREHLAGDLLPPAQVRWNKADGLNESRIGPAHFRLVEHGFQPVDTLDDQVKAVDSQIDVLAKAFQGLTISCARCHDHKFDPISQRDYYALYGVLASTRPAQVQLDSPELLNKNRATLLALKPKIKSTLADAWRDAIPQLLAQLARGSGADPQFAPFHQRVAKLETELAAIESEARTRAGRGKGAPAEPPSVVRLPQPVSRWSFDTDARDQLGSLHGELLGGAILRNGRLLLDGKEAHLRTAPLVRELREKTLEAWVALATLDQSGGGVITVESSNGSVFDSIVFAEKEPRKWVNGSNNFRRSRTLDGVAETAKPGEFVHLAVVYRPDNSVAFYRNGVLYAPAYTPPGEGAALQTFAAGASRVLLGRRHTGGGRAFLAGEIDEARLYDRALTAEEIAASFRTGPVGVSPEALAKAMTPEQKARHATLIVELTKARAELAAKSPSATGDALESALKDAQGNLANPLHAWTKLSKLEGAAFTSGWSDATKSWRDQLAATRQHNSQFKAGWDLAEGDAGKWFTEGAAVSLARSGDFALEPDGDRLLKGLLPAAVSSHLASEKHGGIFTSPRFRITTDSISVRAAGGKGAMVRVIVDNYPLGSNPIFPKAELARDEPGWVRMDTAYRKGSWGYIEFAAADDLTRKLGKNSDGQGRSWFSAARVAFHDKDTPREEPIAPMPLFEGAIQLNSTAELAKHYERTLRAALDAWTRDSLTAEQMAFLDYFLRRGLLPTSLKAIPKAAPFVAEYRRLESEIAAPRRAPGLLEGPAFDAPLFVRGDHTKPGDPVPRGYLQVLSSKPFFANSSAASGRLALAEALASAQNPLTARVMVNRLWHHLFGRGLVPTVDNFGRLGDQPTHPELLDHLAAQFIADGWSFKKLIRHIVTTRAYQLASETTAAVRERDADNAYLSHFRVRRLEAETIRDTLLAVSGRLDATQFGPPVGIGDRARRSVYLSIRRNNLSPFLEIFDAPKPFTTLGRRDTTNVPAQSLAFLNDPFVIESAKSWAEQLLRLTPQADASARIQLLFQAGFARPASADELAKSRAYLASLGTDANPHSPRAWQDFIQSLFNLKEFIYVR